MELGVLNKMRHGNSLWGSHYWRLFMSPLLLGPRAERLNGLWPVVRVACVMITENTCRSFQDGL